MPRKKQPAELTGFAVGTRARRTKTYRCEMDGYEGFEIQVKRLTFAELDELPSLTRIDEDGNTHTLRHYDSWEAMYPYVLGWNAQAETPDGGWEDVPPPAEAGADAFQMLEPELSVWVFGKVKYGHLGGDDLRKKPTPPESTPETPDA